MLLVIWYGMVYKNQDSENLYIVLRQYLGICGVNKLL